MSIADVHVSDEEHASFTFSAVSWARLTASKFALNTLKERSKIGSLSYFDEIMLNTGEQEVERGTLLTVPS